MPEGLRWRFRAMLGPRRRNIPTRPDVTNGTRGSSPNLPNLPPVGPDGSGGVLGHQGREPGEKEAQGRGLWACGRVHSGGGTS